LRAFLTYGLPQVLTLDHGTVFYDHITPSPFPTRLHMWLLTLGVQVRFTRKRCPIDHAIIERTHHIKSGSSLYLCVTASCLLKPVAPAKCIVIIRI
jgi:hypothetical protein